MVVFSKEPKVTIVLDQEKLKEFLAACEQVREQLDIAALKAGEALKQLKEATDSAVRKSSDAAKELNRAAENVRSARPRGPGGRTW